jgi:DNA-binding SARP family transcriptional activator
MLKISVLGPLDLAADHANLGAQPRKTLGLLAYLAMHQGRAVSRELAGDLLWGLHGPEQSRQSLRQALLVLRRALGPYDHLITSAPGTLTMPCFVAQVDAVDFQQLADSSSLADLDRGAQLYRGDFLSGFPDVSPQFEEWVTWERRRLADLAAEILARLATARLQAGGFDEAVAAARRLVGLDPLREDSHRLLMDVLTQAGRRAEALRHYAECRDVLRRELDVAPHPHTTALYRRIRDEAALQAAREDSAQ